MLKKHAVLIGTFISISLLIVAAIKYPGGSQFDINSIGFSWRHNYFSNLFDAVAMNGAANDGRYWGIAGMFFLTLSFAIFFAEFSKKIPSKSAAKVIKYFGWAGTFFAFLIATPLHNLMIGLSSTMFLIGMFYVTVFVFKSRLHLFKFLCIACLLLFYYTLYIYYAGVQRDILPVVQKVTYASTLLVILGLAYFTSREDFVGQKKQMETNEFSK
ncbi:MAG: hypothetical protein ABIV51_06355 [Saprospiraceae bacterium]